MQNNLLPVLLAALILAGGVTPALAAEPATLPDAQILVSPANPLPSYLEPENLVSVKGFVRANGDVKLRADAAQALSDMLAGLKAAGVTDIYANSGYRSYVRQQELHTAKVAYYRRQGSDEVTALAQAARWVLPAGESEHQTGLAVDLSTASLNHDLVEAFAQTPAGQWLTEHCLEYGFIVRYTAEKEPVTGVANEPWHFRYVGADHAYYMRQHNLCLDEYHALLKEQSLLLFANARGENRAVHYSAGDASATLPGTLLSLSLASRGSGEYIITMEPPPEALFDITGHWGEPFIRRLSDLGAVGGYPDGSFRPNAGVSRGEFVTVLSRLPLPAFAAAVSVTPEDGTDVETEEPVAEEESTGRPEADEEAEEALPLGPVILPEVALPYTDVELGQYYYQPLLLCYRASLVQPLAAGDAQPTLFQPTRPLTRSEAALMLAQALSADNFTLPARPSYSDVPAAAGQLYRSVELLTARGVLSGDIDGFFRPERGVSRAEMSAMLCRLLDAVTQEQAQADEAEEPVDTDF